MKPFTSVRRAGRALAALLENPDDLAQVFTIIEAFSHPTYRRVLAGMKRTSEGQAMLDGRTDLAKLLGNRVWLSGLPEGSLGRAYLAFMEHEGISLEGIVEASEARHANQAAPLDAELEYVADRLRDTHDLWHVVTGYRGDLVGELCLLAFSFAQTYNPALFFIFAGGASKGFLSGRWSFAVRAYARGRRATWLPGVGWETWLADPLEDVRTRLGLGAPPAYEPVRSSELRARGKLAAA